MINSSGTSVNQAFLEKKKKKKLDSFSLHLNTDCSAITAFRYKESLSQQHIKHFPCQLKGLRAYCSSYPLGSFSPPQFDIFSILIAEKNPLEEHLPSGSTVPSTPSFQPRADNTRKQPDEAYLDKKKKLSWVPFSHSKLQNMPSYPRCYRASYNTLTWDSVSQRMRVCVPVGDLHTWTQVPLAELYPTDRLRKSSPPTSSPTHVATGMSSDRQGGVEVPIRWSAGAFFPQRFSPFICCHVVHSGSFASTCQRARALQNTACVWRAAVEGISCNDRVSLSGS